MGWAALADFPKLILLCSFMHVINDVKVFAWKAPDRAAYMSLPAQISDSARVALLPSRERERERTTHTQAVLSRGRGVKGAWLVELSNRPLATVSIRGPFQP